MVRYSKLAFRLLVQDYSVDLTYTPMMLAHEYVAAKPRRMLDISQRTLHSQHSTDSSATQLHEHQTSARPPQKAP